MLRRFIRLSLLALLPAACQPPPATSTTNPDDANAQATPGDQGGAAAQGDAPEADADLPPADEVLAQSIEAIGGKAAIDKIESSYAEAKTEIKAQNMVVLTKIWSKGDNYYLESDMPGMGMSQVWKKGDDIWSKDPINGMRKLEGKEAEQARWSTDTLLAANWSKYFDEAKTVGREGEGENEIIKVELSKGEQSLTLLFFADSHLPAGQEFQQETPMGTMPIRITFEDYREVEGVMTAFRNVTDMQLMSAVQTTEKYEVNIEIDDAKFEPPGKQ